MAPEMTEGELYPDEARTAKNGPTEALWPDEGRPEAKDLIHHSTEAPILLHFPRTPGSSGKCRVIPGENRWTKKIVWLWA